MTYETVQVKELDGGCGAEVLGLDLKTMSNRQWDEVQRAFAEHGVIFFRDQNADARAAPRLRASAGARSTSTATSRPSPAIRRSPRSARSRSSRTTSASGWHTDHTYDQIPAMGSILVARELPSTGGDTLFSNVYRAFETLSAGAAAARCAGLKAVHVVGAPVRHRGASRRAGRRPSCSTMPTRWGRRDPSGGDPPSAERPQGALREPRPSRCVSKAGSVEDSNPLLEHLYRHVTRRDFTCRFQLARGLDRLLGQPRDLALAPRTTIRASGG